MINQFSIGKKSKLNCLPESPLCSAWNMANTNVPSISDEFFYAVVHLTGDDKESVYRYDHDQLVQMKVAYATTPVAIYKVKLQEYLNEL
jgi:hypothetical protein